MRLKTRSSVCALASAALFAAPGSAEPGTYQDLVAFFTQWRVERRRRHPGVADPLAAHRQGRRDPLAYPPNLVRIENMVNPCAKLALSLLLLLVAGAAQAQESLDFYAEHAIEGVMDARYLALPQVPEDLQASEWRLRLGGFSYQSGVFAISAVLLDVQRSRPLGKKRALLFGAFADFMDYSGDSGPAIADPTFTREFDAISPFAVDVSKVSGSGMHFGVSAAVAGRFSPRWGWQSGVVLEEVKVDSLKTEFTTLELPYNFSGTLDYAGTYDAVTPFGEVHRSIPGRRYSMSARLIAAIPFPSVGFKGRISGPGFETSGDSGSAGKGKHVPDPFLGLGFSVESRKTGFRIDLGATVYLFAAEGKIHRGVDTPLYLTFSFPLGHVRKNS